MVNNPDNDPAAQAGKSSAQILQIPLTDDGFISLFGRISVWFATLEHVIDQNILREVRGLLPEALSVSDERNRYIHDQWVFDDKLVSAGRIKRVQFVGLEEWKTAIQERELTMQEIAAFMNRIGALQIRFAALCDRLPLCRLGHSHSDKP